MPGTLTVGDLLDSGCFLIWEPLPPDEVDEYIIYIDKNDGNGFKEFTRTKKNEFKITGLENGKKFFFAISNVKNGEKSAMSNKVSVIPEDITPPAPPTGLRSYSGKNYIKINWNPSKEPDFLHYTMYRRTINSKRMNILEEDSGIIKPEYIDNDISNGILYIYGVTATDKYGNESKISKTIEGHTKFTSNITFKFGDKEDKLYGYCYNPNDRSVYQSNSFSKDLQKWSMWRRTVFHFPNPPGKFGRMKNLIITKYKQSERAIIVYPQKGELFVCYKKNKRWNRWEIFSKNVKIPLKLLRHRVIYDSIYDGEDIVTALFDLTKRNIYIMISKKNNSPSKIKLFFRKLPFLPNENNDISFSIKKYDKKNISCYFLLTTSKKLYECNLSKHNKHLPKFNLIVPSFKLPPNF